MSSKMRAMERDDVRRIRTRYNQAIEAGYTVADAAVYANGDAALVPIIKPVVQTVSESGPTKVRDMKPLGLAGKRVQDPEPEIIPVIDYPTATISETPGIEKVTSPIPNEPSSKEITNKIPKDWPDLPWPQLQKLAESFSGGEVKSRKHANKIIEKALR